MVVVTVLNSLMCVSPAALIQRLYRNSSLLLPPVDTGSSQASVRVVLDELTTLTLSGGDGGTACVPGYSLHTSDTQYAYVRYSLSIIYS